MRDGVNLAGGNFERANLSDANLTAKQLIKPHLLYRLVPMEQAAVFQILEMDESQRVRHAEFEASNGITVSSTTGPHIGSITDHVWLRGRNCANDNNLSYRNFNSNELRDAFIADVHRALHEWHEAGGFEQARQYVDVAHQTVVTDGFTYQLGVAK